MNISNRKITSYPYKQGFSYRNMTRIGKKLYLGTMDHGLLCFDISTGEFKENIIDLGCNVIMSLSSDEKNLLFVPFVTNREINRRSVPILSMHYWLIGKE